MSQSAGRAYQLTGRGAMHSPGSPAGRFKLSKRRTLEGAKMTEM